MINVFTVKKWAALIMAGFIPTIMFVLGNALKGLIWALVLFFLGMLLSVVMANFLLRNPFSDMLQGKGLIACNLDSTGLVTFFNVRLDNPKVVGSYFKQQIEDTFDRDAVFNFVPSGKKDGIAVTTPDGGMLIKVNNQEYNKGRFATLQYPLLIWNDQMKTLLTKDFLSDQEKYAFAEHQSLHLNQQMNSLTSVTRDFARYVVNQVKPMSNFMAKHGGKVIVIVILVILVGALAFLFGPAIFNTITSEGGTAIDAVQKASDTMQTISTK